MEFSASRPPGASRPVHAGRSLLGDEAQLGVEKRDTGYDSGITAETVGRASAVDEMLHLCLDRILLKFRRPESASRPIFVPWDCAPA